LLPTKRVRPLRSEFRRSRHAIPGELAPMHRRDSDLPARAVEYSIGSRPAGTIAIHRADPRFFRAVAARLGPHGRGEESVPTSGCGDRRLAGPGAAALGCRHRQTAWGYGSCRFRGTRNQTDLLARLCSQYAVDPVANGSAADAEARDHSLLER